MADMRAMHERNARACTAKAVGGLQIQLVVCNPHGYLGNMCRTLVNLDAKELLNADSNHGADVQQALALATLAEQAVNQVHFKTTQFAVGND